MYEHVALWGKKTINILRHKRNKSTCCLLAHKQHDRPAYQAQSPQLPLMSH